MTDDTETDVISRLPKPHEVRARLGDLLRNLELTRKLLRLSERREHLKTLSMPPDINQEVAPHA